MIRDAAVVAGVSIECLLRAGTFRRMPRPLLLGAGLLTGGAVAALVHLAGADVRGFTGGQPGMLSALLLAASDSESGLQR